MSPKTLEHADYAHRHITSYIPCAFISAAYGLSYSQGGCIQVVVTSYG